MHDRSVTLAQAVEVIIRHLGYREDVASAVVKAARRQKAFPTPPQPIPAESAIWRLDADGIPRGVVKS